MVKHQCQNLCMVCMDGQVQYIGTDNCIALANGHVLDQLTKHTIF